MGGLWSKGLERAQSGEDRLEDKTLNPTTILTVQSFIIEFLKKYMQLPPVRFKTTGNIVRWYLPENVEISYCLTNDCLDGHMYLIRNSLMNEMIFKVGWKRSLYHQIFLNLNEFYYTKNENDLLNIY